MMPWRSDTGYFKLALAGLVHDITLENHELAQLDSLQELTSKVANFTTSEVNNFRRHPIDCAELVRQLDQMPPDVDQMVLQHHEKADGSGFPHKLTALRISPLSALFIVAHDLVRRMHLDGNFDVKEFLLADRPEYNHGPFKRVLRDTRAFINGAPATEIDT